MKVYLSDELIPGTKLKQAEMGGVTGLDFLKQVFYISEGVMLTQIRDISGIDSSTLQNWTKRGWVANSHLKKYDIDQVAHILIINMLRSCMQLDKIAFLIQYINGDVEDTSDDIVRDSELYDYICRTLEYMKDGQNEVEGLDLLIEKVTKEYVEPVAGGRTRLNAALKVIVVAYCASMLKHSADELMADLILPSNRHETHF